MHILYTEIHVQIHTLVVTGIDVEVINNKLRFLLILLCNINVFACLFSDCSVLVYIGLPKQLVLFF